MEIGDKVSWHGVFFGGLKEGYTQNDLIVKGFKECCEPPVFLSGENYIVEKNTILDGFDFIEEVVRLDNGKIFPVSSENIKLIHK